MFTQLTKKVDGSSVESREGFSAVRIMSVHVGDTDFVLPLII